MNIKDNERNLQLIKSKKSKIKYIILLIISFILLILFSLSLLNLISRNSIFLGNSLTELLTNSTFLFLGTIFFVDFIIFSIYGAIKNLIETDKIVFDKIKKELWFIKHNKLLRKDSSKKVPFFEISEIKVEQELDSEYISLSIFRKNEKITIESDYGEEGTNRLNSLAENLQEFIKVPIQKGQFEDIYIEEEEDKEKNSGEGKEKP
ncbi:MAG: hypothetical protein HWN67_12035 [Candidatus Helarchaeota archaeon]|nr:hypothetical protein [Candidatus Helarchaeota archaeon]